MMSKSMKLFGSSTSKGTCPNEWNDCIEVAEYNSYKEKVVG